MRNIVAGGAAKSSSGTRCIRVSASNIKRFIRTSTPAVATLPGAGRLEKAHAYVHRLETILRESPDLSITLEDLSQILDLERTYCCKVFPRITGKSFSKWIRRIRIERAQALLRIDLLSITHVSHAVGYGDITTFERAFRKELGLSPQSFRRLVGAAATLEPATHGKLQQSPEIASKEQTPALIGSGTE